jgi:hypothetical protein
VASFGRGFGVFGGAGVGVGVGVGVGSVVVIAPTTKTLPSTIAALFSAINCASEWR